MLFTKPVWVAIVINKTETKILWTVDVDDLFQMSSFTIDIDIAM